MRMFRLAAALAATLSLGFSGIATTAAAPQAAYDTIIRGGTVYDGSGGEPYVADIAIEDDRIAEIAPRIAARGDREVDAAGLAVAPGFINMLSWANESLIADGRGLSDIKQGVTLEVMGEGLSMGPLNPEMKRLAPQRQDDIRYDIAWTSLGDYLEYLEAKGVSPNVASFVGATTVRIHELGEENVDPTPAQLQAMRRLVREAMNEGAMGVGSSLIYAPANFAETDELVALATEAAQCGGMYISHMRNEGDQLIEAIDELVEISRRSGAPAEIYHLKMSGRGNWHKYDEAIARIEAARAAGLRITADMYTYPAAGTGLDAAMPLWVQEGGLERWIERLRDPEIRARVAAEMRGESGGKPTSFLAAGPDKMLLAGFKNEALKPLAGKTLAEIAAMRGTDPAETAIDLVVEDGSRVFTIYFLMTEENVRKQVALPWVSFGSDAEASAPEGVFLKSSTHPRAYGNFARLLGHYSRDEGLVPLAEAVRRMTSFPAANLGIKDRGALRPGYHADIAIFDPDEIGDRATFEEPQQLAVGMRHVFVNGVAVLKDGEHTGATPGRFVRGPGYGTCPSGA